MEKKIVLITGGSRGIGRAVAKRLAQGPYRLAIAWEKEKEAADNVVSYVTACGGEIISIQADVRKQEDVNRLFDQIEATYGGTVDILVHCAGIASYGFFDATTEEEWMDLFNVNVHGSYRVARRAIPAMLSNRFGRILFMSSIWGMIGGAMEVPYSATKGAIIAMTKALAKEVGYNGVTVNTLAPGGVETDMLAPLSEEDIAAYCDSFPQGRLGTPEEMADWVAFLISDAASYMTGQVVSPNGGAVI